MCKMNETINLMCHDCMELTAHELCSDKVHYKCPKCGMINKDYAKKLN